MAKYFRPNIPKRLRFKVLKRDGFTCRYCGLSPTNCDDVVLHADHIVSVSDGGATNEQNLITACDCCNLGKWKDSLSQEEVISSPNSLFSTTNIRPGSNAKEDKTTVIVTSDLVRRVFTLRNGVLIMRSEITKSRLNMKRMRQFSA